MSWGFVFNCRVFMCTFSFFYPYVLKITDHEEPGNVHKTIPFFRKKAAIAKGKELTDLWTETDGREYVWRVWDSDGFIVDEGQSMIRFVKTVVQVPFTGRSYLK